MTNRFLTHWWGRTVFRRPPSMDGRTLEGVSGLSINGVRAIGPEHCLPRLENGQIPRALDAKASSEAQEGVTFPQVRLATVALALTALVLPAALSGQAHALSDTGDRLAKLTRMRGDVERA